MCSLLFWEFGMGKTNLGRRNPFLGYETHFRTEKPIWSMGNPFLDEETHFPLWEAHFRIEKPISTLRCPFLPPETHLNRKKPIPG